MSPARRLLLAVGLGVLAVAGDARADPPDEPPPVDVGGGEPNREPSAPATAPSDATPPPVAPPVASSPPPSPVTAPSDATPPPVTPPPVAISPLPPPVMTVSSADGDGRWRPRREVRFGAKDYVITGVALSGIVVGAVITPSGNRWRGGILFDEAARDALRFDSLQGRYWVRDMSDVGISLASTWPFLVDALITAWWYRGRAGLALDMALVSSEAFALAAAVQSMGNLIGSRERPYGRLCGKTIPEESVDCEANVRYRSFFSGHATLSFTGAGLVCMNHLGLGLLGQVGDTLSCVGGYAVATATSLFRVMSDMHYASDAIIGAMIGTAAGIGIPLLHFESRPSGVAKIDWHLGTVGQGLGVEGTF